MKCFLPLVQEREAKVPALVWEAVARAAAAPPPPPPCLPVVLREMFDCKTSCFTPKVTPDVNFNDLACSPIIPYPAVQISATLPATAGENLSFPAPLLSACIHKGKNKVVLPREHNLLSTKSSLNLSVDVA